ncbi:SDR family NAD(P)-dependent oxidoreductase [Desulfosarcina ovata]|uniref:3-oxoacyl-ACP reductase n=1 Tax=Desulfosarcina ovata subsp. ovata TaxID=2752305 RepID=A0A5K8ADV4_9BACT|nr:SDR family oxidoreductase [Desulfosarcina ovata]BBO90741.1 3-oxoacyl-ACP reductase [Desulfosarcina ovata subsp. ovata]
MTKSPKVALVLGAVKGIGKAIALDLLQHGIRVAATWFDWPESQAAMQADFADTGTEHLIQRIDLLNPHAIDGLLEPVIDRFGRLDILVNNIERGGWPVVHGRYIPEQWDLELATTLRAKRWVFEAALPHLKASGDGSVVNISSIAGMVGRSGPASVLFNEGYAAANRGISLLTETWARLGAPEVRVNELMIGVVETRHGPQTRGWGLLTAAQQQAIVDHTLLARIGRIDDVVRAVRFLLDDAPFMTGSVLRLDGGYPLGGEAVAPMPDGVV